MSLEKRLAKMEAIVGTQRQRITVDPAKEYQSFIAFISQGAIRPEDVPVPLEIASQGPQEMSLPTDEEWREISAWLRYRAIDNPELWNDSKG